MRIDRLAAEYDVKVVYRHFPLHPETPPGGLTLEQLFAGRRLDISAMQQQMADRMAVEGLPYGSRTMTYNSRLAQELAAWAVPQPGGDAIHDALFRAYFVDGRNIGDITVLLDVARSIGLPVDEAEQVLESRSHRQAVDADWERARQLRISSVPTFVAGDRAVVGAQPYEALEQLIRGAGA